MNQLAPIRVVTNPNGDDATPVDLVATEWRRLDPRPDKGSRSRLNLVIRNTTEGPMEIWRSGSETPPPSSLAVGIIRIAAMGTLSGWYAETVRHYGRMVSGTGTALVQEGGG